jgi:hypothetical protein
MIAPCALDRSNGSEHVGEAGPGWSRCTGDQPPAPIELRRALATIDRVIADYTNHARLNSAA